MRFYLKRIVFYKDKRRGSDLDVINQKFIHPGNKEYRTLGIWIQVVQSTRIK